MRVVSGLTLASRVLGLVRDLQVAALFGTTGVGSAYAAGFTAPNLFRRLFGEGALSAAVVPAFVTLDQRDPDAAARLATAVTIRLLAALAALCAVVVGGLGLLWANASAGEQRLSIALTMIMMPYMPLICGVGLISGVMQARGRFVMAAASPVVLNLVLIAAASALVWAMGSEAEAGRASSSAYWLSAALLLAGVLQMAWALVSMRRERLWQRGPHDHDAARTALKRFVPAAIGLGALQLSTVIDMAVAMWPIWVGPTMFGLTHTLDEASNAVLFYAQRLYQFPLGVFGLAIATVAFPALARTANNDADFAAALRRSLRLSLFIGLPASIGLALISRDAVIGLFGGLGERFSEAERVASALTGYAAGVWAYSLNQVLARACYARGDTRTPMTIAFVGLGLNAGLNLALIWPLREAGLGWATSITATVQTAMYLLLWSKRLAPARSPGPPDDAGLWARGLLPAFASIAAISAVMGAGVWWLERTLHAAGGPLAAWSPVDAARVSLVIEVLVAVAVFVAAAWLSRRPELGWLLGRRRASPANNPSEGTA